MLKFISADYMSVSADGVAFTYDLQVSLESINVNDCGHNVKTICKLLLLHKRIANRGCSDAGVGRWGH